MATTTLTDAERETLGTALRADVIAALTEGDDPPALLPAVERLLTARLARVEALADEWEATRGPSRVAFLVAADELRTVLRGG